MCNNILFLSDLHMGSVLFNTEHLILKLLDSGRYDLVVIVGDIIDIWERSSVFIEKKHKYLIHRFNELGDKLIVVRGNHDPDFYELNRIFFNCNICNTYTILLNSKKVLITHGDMFDTILNKFMWLIKIGQVFFWVFERAFNYNLRSFFCMLRVNILSKLCGKSPEDVLLSIEKKIIKTYEDIYDIVITGHTHLPKIIKKDNILYMNCGDWIYNNSFIEYYNGSFNLIKLN